MIEIRFANQEDSTYLAHKDRMVTVQLLLGSNSVYEYVVDRRKLQ